MAVVLILSVVVVLICSAYCSDSNRKRRDEHFVGTELDRLDDVLANSEMPVATSCHGVNGICRYDSSASVFETRIVRSGTAFAGPTISVPLVRSVGLRFRAGYLAHSQIRSERLTLIDTGRMVVSDSEIVFFGASSTTATEIRDIVSVDLVRVSNTGHAPLLVSVRRSRGKVRYYQVEHPGDLLGVIARLTGSDSVVSLCP